MVQRNPHKIEGDNGFIIKLFFKKLNFNIFLSKNYDLTLEMAIISLNSLLFVEFALLRTVTTLEKFSRISNNLPFFSCIDNYLRIGIVFSRKRIRIGEGFVLFFYKLIILELFV